MANNYDEFSTSFAFPKKAANDFMDAINGISGVIGGAEEKHGIGLIPGYILDRIAESQEGQADFRGKDAELLADCLYENFAVSGLQTEYENGRLWMGADEYVNIDAAAGILSWVMERHEIREPVCFSSCYYCDKLRPDEFGGVAWAVGPGIVKAIGTQEMARNLGQEMREELAEPDSPKAPR